MPSSQSLDTRGCRRQHMPWRTAPGKGYGAALWRLRKRSSEHFGASPRQVLEREIKEMVAGANAEGILKRLLSACTQLDKVRLHPRIVETGDWQVAKWLAKRRVRGESALVRWAPMELLVWPAEQVLDLASAEVVALASMSVACLLRVGEAATIRTSAREDVSFNGKKRATGHLRCRGGSVDEVVGTVPLGNQTTQARAGRLALFPLRRGGVTGKMQEDCWRVGF